MAKTKELQDEILKMIIDDMEKGDLFWEKPWAFKGIYTAPINSSTTKNYRGMNSFILKIMAMKKGQASNQWLTFKQAQKLGGAVKKGAKSVPCFFYSMVEKKDKNTGEVESRFPVMNYFRVFNLEDIEGLDSLLDLELKAIRELPQVERIGRIESAVKATKADVREIGQDHAFYSPSQDQITMPLAAQFKDLESYYATLFHELVHWTGHEKRCNRNLKGWFGNESYAFEELVAELGAAMLCAQFDLEYRTQHAAYLKTWIRCLKDDPKALFKAASLAQKAVDHLMKLMGMLKTEETETNEENAEKSA